MKTLFPFLLPLVLVLSSCEFGSNEAEKPSVARVFDQYLYAEEIAGLVQPGTSPEDSVAIVNGFIQNWITQKLLLQKAELNLTEEKKDVSQQLENYRNSLIIYSYERELVRNKLDTNVTSYQILEYYERNKHNFELKDYILQLDFLILDKATPELDQVREWFVSEDPEDRFELEEYAGKFAVKYFMDQEKWLYYDEVAREIPIATENKQQFLSELDQMEFEDESRIYMLKLLDYKMKDSITPLDLELSTIKNIILNQRKLKLVEDMKKDIFEDALSRGHFEILEN